MPLARARASASSADASKKRYGYDVKALASLVAAAAPGVTRVAPDVSTVDHAARLRKRYSDAEVGIPKTCTRIAWDDGASSSSSSSSSSSDDGDGEPSTPTTRKTRAAARGGFARVSLSAKRGALTSLGALARAAHLNGWKLVTHGDDSACQLYWCCRARDLAELTEYMTSAHEQRVAKRAAIWKRALTRAAGMGNGRSNATALRALRGEAADMRYIRDEIARARASIEGGAHDGDDVTIASLPPPPSPSDVPLEDPTRPCPRRLRLRVAKFPGMNQICDKVRFARLMNQAAKLFPDAFEFWPTTVILPDDVAHVGEAMGGEPAGRRREILLQAAAAARARAAGGDGDDGEVGGVRGITAGLAPLHVGGGGGNGSETRETPAASIPSASGVVSSSAAVAAAARPPGPPPTQNGPRWHIVKPDNGSQGKGIFLVKNLYELAFKLKSKCPEVWFGYNFNDGTTEGRRGAGKKKNASPMKVKRIHAEVEPPPPPTDGPLAPTGKLNNRAGTFTMSGLANVPDASKRDADAAAGGFVVQRYVTNPLLIGGVKFDLRLYVLLLGADDFPAFLSKEGLARFCTVKYAPPSSKTLAEVRGYLTNYALNKGADEFVRSDDVHASEGSKRSLASLMTELARKGHDVDALWTRLERLVDRTIGAMRHAVRDAAVANRAHPEMCFQVLGFDVMLDENLKPYLLEVNSSPSLAIDSVEAFQSHKTFTTAAGAEGSNDRRTDVLERCASLDAPYARCLCANHKGEHAHVLSPVDAHVKSAVLAGALDIVRRAQRGQPVAANARGESEGAPFRSSSPVAKHGGYRAARAGRGGGAGWWIDRDEEEKPPRLREERRRRRVAGWTSDEEEEEEDSSAEGGGGEAGKEEADAAAKEHAEGEGEGEDDDDDDDDDDEEEEEEEESEEEEEEEDAIDSPVPAVLPPARADDPSEKLSRLYARVEKLFVRVVDRSKTFTEREASFARVRRMVSLARLKLTNADMDLILLPWKQRRGRAGSGFNHFLDLVMTLAGKAFPNAVDGADAVGSVLEELARVSL